MVEVFITFMAGMISFISPCVFPLVPAYIGYMSGRVTHTVAAQIAAAGHGSAALRPNVARFSTMMHAVAFVSGFTFIFVLLGVASAAVMRSLGGTNAVTDLIGRLGGMMIIFFGLHFMGLLPWLFGWLRRHEQLINYRAFSVFLAFTGSAALLWGFTGTLTPWAAGSRAPVDWMIYAGAVAILGVLALMGAGGAFTRPGIFWVKFMNTVEQALYADTRIQMTASGNQSYGGSALMGIVFAAGWTPCIGPTLGAALTLAANTGSADVVRGGVLLMAYSLGLGIPFLVTALMLDSAQNIFRKLQRNMRAVTVASGLFLVMIGYLVASGALQSLSLRFSREFADFSYQVEKCTVGLFEGDVRWSELGACYRDDPTPPAQPAPETVPSTGRPHNAL